MGFLNRLLSTEQSFEQLLSFPFEVVGFRRPFQQSADGFFHFLLHLLLHLAGQTFDVNSVCWGLRSAGDRQGKTEPAVFHCDLDNRRRPGELVAHLLREIQVDEQIQLLVESDGAAARGLKVMTVHQEILQLDETLLDGEVRLDRGEDRGFGVIDRNTCHV